MSFLYPLFLAGAAAIGVPILLHLIRRYTRKRVSFSSLMFLKPSPPRFQRRSRLEHLPLLLLRCLMLVLLALAFARPFLAATSGQPETLSGRRVVVLMDTSASMQRDGLWDQAVDEIRNVLTTLSAMDRVCLIQFDKTPRILMSFASWAALPADRRRSVLLEQIEALSPTWHGTHLGQALIAAAEILEDDDVYDAERMTSSRTVVLISDLQEGSDIQDLQAYEWPAGTQLQIRSVQASGKTNAALHRINGSEQDPRTIGIRLTNTAQAERDLFDIRWARPDEDSREVYVPAGHASVVSLPYPDTNGSLRLILRGDDHDFDNTLYVAPPAKPTVRVLLLGQGDPNDPEGVSYYLSRALKSDTSRRFHIATQDGEAPVAASEFQAAHVFVVTGRMSTGNLDRLQEVLVSGRTVLLSLTSTEAVDPLLRLTGREVPVRLREAEVDGYAMLSRLDFEHPILAPFADPKFGDFTRIHVWRYRRIDPADFPQARIPIGLDTGDPAWMIQPCGEGTLVVTTFGWHPEDSDLALSSKFVPLLSAVLEYGGAVTSHPSHYFVGDEIAIQASATTGRVHTPDGRVVSLAPEQDSFAQTDRPGLYTLETASGSREFAVNVPVRECRTEPMPIETLEQLGVTAGPHTDGLSASHQQKQSNINAMDLEYEQKLWRKCLMALLIVMLIEMWLGGWLTRLAPAGSPARAAGGAGAVAQGEAQ